MSQLYKNAMVYTDGHFVRKDLFVNSGIVSDDITAADGAEVFDFNNCCIFPGFADVHVHLREPGFSYKETIKSGAAAAARGGFTAVCAMPNLSPVPDSAENLRVQTDIAARDACINVFPYAAITVGEQGERLSDMDALSKLTKFFSDDGRGVQSESIMRSAMEKAASLGVIIAAHCEDNELLGGKHIRAGEYAKAHGIRGINPESEWRQLERDLRIASETGCKYHVCHVSTAESVELLRRAKRSGVDVTAETAPHYLALTENDLCDDGRFKMNPPLGSLRDREALREGVADDTIDMIATDHAPHSTEEKSGGLENSLMGVSGIEAAFPVLYTSLVRKGIITLERLTELLSVAPRCRFMLGGGDIRSGRQADLTVFDTETEFVLDSADFLSMGKSTPFDKMRCRGKCLLTVCGGKTVWRERGI